jgi:agmatine deiminase
VGWPHNAETWPGCLEAAEEEFSGLVRALAESEPVHVLVQDASQLRRVRQRLTRDGAGLGIHLQIVPTDDSWLRDTGPTFVQNQQGGLVALDWTFNAWGGKYPPWDRDDAAADRIGALAGAKVLRPGLVLEGGGLEVDGEGTLLVNEATIVDPRRNPGLSRQDMEVRLSELLGVTRVVWLAGAIAGDDTDGHIDVLARFVSPGRVVCASETDSSDPNHAPLEECFARLRSARDARGRALEVLRIPMPNPIEFEGQRVPATHINFYISNSRVLVPVFGVPTDWEALEQLADLFPDRQVVGVRCRALVRGLGTVHCLTQQQPKGWTP